MKNFKNAITLSLLLMVFAVTSAFAGTAPSPQQQRSCAHAYRDCLKACNQMKSDADAARKQCEADAYANNPAGSPELKNALAACRSAYNQAMQSVSTCKAECKRQYDICMGGGYD